MADIHKIEHLFQNGHLSRKIVGHTPPRRLISVIHLMSERRSMLVERHRDIFRAVFRYHAHEYIGEAVHRSRRTAVLCRKQRKREIRTVYQAVAVDQNQLLFEFHAYIIPAPRKKVKVIRKRDPLVFADRVRKYSGSQSRLRKRLGTARYFVLSFLSPIGFFFAAQPLHDAQSQPEQPPLPLTLRHMTTPSTAATIPTATLIITISMTPITISPI